LAYLIAAVLSDGTTTLAAAEQIERGYGDLTQKLRNTNIRLERIEK
jgi:UDP-N-acetylglucosamine enolpyruvyl transferase